MQKYNLDINNFKQDIVFFFVLYSSLISFILGENSTGGAIIDYNNQKLFPQNLMKIFLIHC